MTMETFVHLWPLMQRLGIDSTVISTLDYLAAPSLVCETISPEDEEMVGRTAAALRQAAAAAERLGLGFHYQFPRPIASENGCRENIKRSLFVSADGSVASCVFVNIPADIADPMRRVFGNVHEKSPVEIWESDEYQHFRNRLAQGDPDSPCQTCPKRLQLEG